MAAEFKLERFLKTAALLSSPNEQERATAAKQATALLAQVNLSWEEVLRRGLAPAMPSAHSGFGDMFRDLREKANQAATAAAEAVNARTAPPPTASVTPLQGEDIPHTIEGTVLFRDKRRIDQTSHVLLFGIRNRDRGEQYEPLTTTDPATIATLEQAIANGTPVAGRVRHHTDLGLPQFILSRR